MGQLDETHAEQAELKQLLNSSSVQVSERTDFLEKFKNIFIFLEIARMPRFSSSAKETKKKKYKPDKEAKFY